MAKYFTMAELCRSQTADKLSISNVPTTAQAQSLQLLMDCCLDPVRIKWRKPLIVNSGFRNEPLNVAVGGAKTSQHRLGEAADITAGSVEKNIKLFNMIKDDPELIFDQLILENGGQWVHISYNTDGEYQRRQVLKIG